MQASDRLIVNRREPVEVKARIRMQRDRDTNEQLNFLFQTCEILIVQTRTASQNS